MTHLLEKEIDWQTNRENSARISDFAAFATKRTYVTTLKPTENRYI
jgi:hypothetical protein